ncbi:molecular chaperone TorD family protein [Adlercreutzia sp. R21]|uniref:molecular chaperone TorD family protein n=1 Tax=Adlercreutzia wanghongyangiae TaxID=3111451 RepID=UPI002DBE1CC0|nr:molecular chaperone TorD family protein [Adlercreutzia sp. R21]MEC4183908.1 molecular chaperone TorD family protein [Adlercreutzia sp. R21]
MESKMTAEMWMHRASAFELLSLAFLLPSRPLAEAVAAGEYAEAADEVFGLTAPNDARVTEAAAHLAAAAGGDGEATLHALRREHTRLLVGEKEPLLTPYAGIWRAQQQGQQGLLFVSETSLAIERFMARCGVAKDLAAGQTNDPVDHIGTMAEFLQFLCLVQAEAVQAPEGAVIGADDFDAFFAEYFAPYACWLASELAAQTRSEFFKGAALLLAVAAERF